MKSIRAGKIKITLSTPYQLFQEIFILRESLDKHTDEKHNAAVNCEDCDHLKEHIKEHHTIEQLDGLSELQKSTKSIEHDELWCHKCPDQLPNRPAMKAHMHNEHNITIFEDIDMEMHGGFRNYRIPGRYYSN